MSSNFYCDGVDKAPQRSLFNALGTTADRTTDLYKSPTTGLRPVRKPVRKEGQKTNHSEDLKPLHKDGRPLAHRQGRTKVPR